MTLQTDKDENQSHSEDFLEALYDSSEFDVDMSFRNYEISGYTLKMTCFACGEAYDVFHNGSYSGYVRVRYGQFVAKAATDGGDAVVMTMKTKGDGMFDDEQERMACLTAAIEAIRAGIPALRNDTCSETV